MNTVTVRAAAGVPTRSAAAAAGRLGSPMSIDSGGSAHNTAISSRRGALRRVITYPRAGAMTTRPCVPAATLR